MPRPYIPNRDADLDGWLATFQTLVAADPPRYGLVTADSDEITSYVNTWHAALLLVQDLGTKTRGTVAAKDAAKAACLDIVRPYAMLIKQNAGVAVEDKAALGLNLRDVTPTPVPPPSLSPSLELIGASPLEHTLRFSTPIEGGASRAKPAGAIGLQLWGDISATAPAGPEACRFFLFATRAKFSMSFGSGDVGKTCYYYGRWQNAKGQVGPWSTRLSFTVAA